MSKRTIESFYKPITQNKKQKPDPDPDSIPSSYTNHPSYPHPIATLPASLSSSLASIRTSQPKTITNQPHLDLLYYRPLIPPSTARDLFHFLRRELPFYRVQYSIQRGGQPMQINTPRFTTVFGIDETGVFIPSSHDDDADSDPFRSLIPVDSKTQNAPTKYQYTPRPIPPCLDALRKHVEAAIGDGSTYNFCLVNYYASGDDSISYHSDDERFLGLNPSIASISLGAQRDFLMRHKPSQAGESGISNQPMKFSLASGDMIVMRGETQANWLHSIPKRKGGEVGKGRINITLRKAVVPGGTNNYYNYNVGTGGVYRWDEGRGEMVAQPADET